MKDYYPRLPHTLAPRIYEHLMQGGEALTPEQLTQMGLSHALNYYQVQAILTQMQQSGVIEKRSGKYRLTAPYQARARRKL